MALAGAKLFVEQGAHVFISGRRQEALDEAVKLIGRNVTGVQADSASRGAAQSTAPRSLLEKAQNPSFTTPFSDKRRSTESRGEGGA